MDIFIIDEGAATVVRLEGDFISEVDQVAFRDQVYALTVEQKTNIVVDFKGVSYINSCGLGALVSVFATLCRVGGMLRLACVGSDVAKVIAKTKLDLIFDIYPSVESALSE